MKGEIRYPRAWYFFQRQVKQEIKTDNDTKSFLQYYCKVCQISDPGIFKRLKVTVKFIRY